MQIGDAFSNRQSHVVTVRDDGNIQVPIRTIRGVQVILDRDVVVDDKELYLIGASLKDLGRKCFAFTKLDPGEITRTKKSAFSTSVP